MKYIFALIVGLISLPVQAQNSSAIPLNGIVARVNDYVITVKEVFAYIAPDLDFLSRRYAQQPALFEQKAMELRSKAVEELIERQLILHEFRTGGFSLPESYFEDQVAKHIRTDYGNRATLTKTLQAEDVRFETYRQRIRERVILSVMQDHFVPRDPLISPFKIETYYKNNEDKFKLEDQVKLRMIVLTNSPDEAVESSRKMAQEIIAKLDEGAEFADMARVYSHGSQSVEGGDWGWVERSVLREDLSAVAFSLTPGQRSDVLEKPDACYILLVEETKPAHTRPLSEVRGEIESVLKAEELNRLRKKWIDRLKAKSFVQYFPE